MRILWFSKDSPALVSAYGRLADELLVKRLARSGRHEFAGFATVGFDSAAQTYDGVKFYPKFVDITGEDIADAHYNDWKADLYVTACDPWIMSRTVEACQQGRMKWLNWTFVDHELTATDAYQLNTALMAVPVSKWGESELRRIGVQHVTPNIYCGLNTQVFKPIIGLTDESGMITKPRLKVPFLGKGEENTFLIGIFQMNQLWRKPYDIQFEGIKLFLENNRDVHVGVYVHAIAQASSAWNIPKLAESYGLNCKYADQYKQILGLEGYNDDDMCKLYSTVDVALMATSGEGFGYPCLPPDTKIITLEGEKPIREIGVGELVLTHRGNFKPVSQIFSRDYEGNMVEITPWNIRTPISLTPEHPVLSIKRPPQRSYRHKPGKRVRPWSITPAAWRPAHSLRKGDCVIFPVAQTRFHRQEYDLKNFDNPSLLFDDAEVWYKMGYSRYHKESPRKLPRKIPLNSDLARLLGYYIAGGSVNSTQLSCIEFTLGGTEHNFALEIKKLMLNLFKTEVEITVPHGRNVSRITCSSRVLARFFSTLCGTGARRKQIPTELLYGDPALLEELIYGIWRGDGTKTLAGMCISTSSRQLVEDLKIGLIRIGFKPRIQHNKRRDEYGVYYLHDQHNYIHSNKSWWFSQGEVNGIAFLVKAVRRHVYSGEVCNLKVEEDESYVTPSFNVHNCLEAQACGTPSIVTDFSALHELSEVTPELRVKPALWFTVPDGYRRKPLPDPYDIADKLETVLKTDPEYYRRRCVEFASRRCFNWDYISRQWLDVLDEAEAEIDRLCLKMPPTAPALKASSHEVMILS